MKRKRHSEEQIVKILQEFTGGIKATDICRKYGISDATLYNWRNKYQSMTVSELKRLKDLEEENRKLKHIVADQALDIKVLKDVNSKNW